MGNQIRGATNGKKIKIFLVVGVGIVMRGYMPFFRADLSSTQKGHITSLFPFSYPYPFSSDIRNEERTS